MVSDRDDTATAAAATAAAVIPAKPQKVLGFIYRLRLSGGRPAASGCGEQTQPAAPEWQQLPAPPRHLIPSAGRQGCRYRAEGSSYLVVRRISRTRARNLEFRLLFRRQNGSTLARSPFCNPASFQRLRVPHKAAFFRAIFIFRFVLDVLNQFERTRDKPRSADL